MEVKEMFKYEISICQQGGRGAELRFSYASKERQPHNALQEILAEGDFQQFIAKGFQLSHFAGPFGIIKVLL